MNSPKPTMSERYERLTSVSGSVDINDTTDIVSKTKVLEEKEKKLDHFMAFFCPVGFLLLVDFCLSHQVSHSNYKISSCTTDQTQHGMFWLNSFVQSKVPAVSYSFKGRRDKGEVW